MFNDYVSSPQTIFNFNNLETYFFIEYKLELFL